MNKVHLGCAPTAPKIINPVKKDHIVYALATKVLEVDPEQDKKSQGKSNDAELRKNLFFEKNNQTEFTKESCQNLFTMKPEERWTAVRAELKMNSVPNTSVELATEIECMYTRLVQILIATCQKSYPAEGPKDDAGCNDILGPPINSRDVPAPKAATVPPQL